MKRAACVPVAFVVCLAAWDAMALVIPHDKGVWPDTWPKELEPLRKRSKMLDVATGIQEHIYTIPFEDREEFERLWPVLLKLRTPGSPLTLSKAGEAGRNQFLSNAKPCVRIKGPTGGYAGGTLKDGRINLKELEAGTMLFAGAPWPKELLGPKGELPEYVTSVKLKDGKLAWKSSQELVDGERGFLNRARVDLELVIDGTVIDLNRIALPGDAYLIDRRFPEPTQE